MAKRRVLSPLPLLDEPSLNEFLAKEKLAPEHGRRLVQKICQSAAASGTDGDNSELIGAVANFPRRLADSIGKDAFGDGGDEDWKRAAKADGTKFPFQVLTSALVSATPASDGSTTKLLIRLQDGHLIESVLIRYGQVDIKSYPEELREGERQRAVERLKKLDAKRRDSTVSDGTISFKARKRRDSGSSIATNGTSATSASRPSNKALPVPMLQFPSGPREHASKPRLTLCVSSQIGCAMACTFCATGTMGLLGSLTAGEILEQIVHAQRLEGGRIRNVVVSERATSEAKIERADRVVKPTLLGSCSPPRCPFYETSIARYHSDRLINLAHRALYFLHSLHSLRSLQFMGMGEPLDNYDAVRLAVKAMTDSAKFGMQAKRVSVSTVGVVPRLIAMKSDPVLSKVSLALSLHGGDQKTRIEIVPTAKAWDISRIVDAASAFVENQNGLLRVPDESDAKGFRVERTEQTPTDAQFRHLLLEYILIKDVNSTVPHAETLADLLSALPLPHLTLLTNLIPYNPVLSITAKRGYQPPSFAETSAFADVLRKRGLKVLVRQEMGQDVGSACGQLVVEGPNTANGDAEVVKDIEELGATSVRNRKVNGVVKKTRKETVKDESEDDGLVPPEVRTEDGFAPLLEARKLAGTSSGLRSYMPVLVGVLVLLMVVRIWIRALGVIRGVVG
jgi:adenine C2-methylase RlmN of 23S rRNA A2503 and tRNA A37